MQTPSVFPKRNPLAKGAQSRWRRRAKGRSTLTARASHIIEARGTLGLLFHNFIRLDPAAVKVLAAGLSKKPSHHSGRVHFYRELNNVNRATMNMVENLPRHWFVFRFVIRMAGQFSMFEPPSFQIW